MKLEMTWDCLRPVRPTNPEDIVLFLSGTQVGDKYSHYNGGTHFLSNFPSAFQQSPGKWTFLALHGRAGTIEPKNRSSQDNIEKDHF
jgi:hypothetical protein